MPIIKFQLEVNTLSDAYAVECFCTEKSIKFNCDIPGYKTPIIEKPIPVIDVTKIEVPTIKLKKVRRLKTEPYRPAWMTDEVEQELIEIIEKIIKRKSGSQSDIIRAIADKRFSAPDIRLILIRHTDKIWKCTIEHNRYKYHLIKKA